MHEITGNIWDYQGQATIVITTNCGVDRRGRAVIGRGCARQALEYFPDFPERLGQLLQEQGARVHDLGNGLVSFPVEETAWSLPDLCLIRESARQLRDLVNENGWTKIIVPRPGCGGGGLNWHSVRPILQEYFDERFHVINI